MGVGIRCWRLGRGDRHPGRNQLRRSTLRLRPFFVYALASAATAACSDRFGGGSSTEPRVTLATHSSADTLRLAANTSIADAVWITTDRDGRYVVVDRSEGNIKVYDRVGTLQRVAGSPGVSEGEFTTLLGGGIVSDSIVGYDFMTTRLSVFDRKGRFARSLALAGPGKILPLTVRSVDDSLLLVVGVPAGSHRRSLLTLMDLRGAVRAHLFNRQHYFADAADLIQQTIVIAAAGHGIIAAGLLGSDSLWIFDYKGHEVASGPILVDGRHIPNASALRTANGGKMKAGNGASILAGRPLLTSAAVLNSRTILLQIMTYDYGRQPRLDRTVGGRYILMQVEPERRGIRIAAEQDRNGGLLGQTREGEALVLRYLDVQYRTVEIARLTTLAPRDTVEGRQ